MQRSSESIAAAAALAKAQAELINPEKSLVATIRSNGPGEAERIVPLCPAIEWARHRAQDLRAARNRDYADYGDRPNRRDRQFHHSVGARLGRMDLFGLASLPRSARPRHRIGWVQH